MQVLHVGELHERITLVCPFCLGLPRSRSCSSLYPALDCILCADISGTFRVIPYSVRNVAGTALIGHECNVTMYFICRRYGTFLLSKIN